jgi:hypothetical protein
MEKETEREVKTVCLRLIEREIRITLRGLRLGRSA